MHTALIIFSSAFAVASASLVQVVPVSYILNPLPTYNQIQNTRTGEYAYSYAGGPSAKEEIKTLDGVTRGAYSYIDAYGILQSAHYVADSDGFRVAATNIPTDAKIGVNAPLETPEVQAAKAAHFAEHAKAVAALGRKKRSLSYALPVASAVSSQYHNQERETVKIATPTVYQEYVAAVPVQTYHATYAQLPVAVSHQSRVQTHNSARVEAPAHLNYVELSASPVAAVEIARTVPDQVISYQVPSAVHITSVSSVPTAVSSQSRYQVHSGQKVELQTPVYDSVPLSVAPATPAVATAPAADRESDTVIVDAFRAAAPVAAVPTAVSSQSRTQVHSSAHVELEAPLVQPIAAPVVDSYGHPGVAVSARVYGPSHLVSQVPLDTPEVAAAKREHAKAYAAELAKHQGW